ncbi:MAG: beta-lactamase family protein, partial [Pseudomonadales bacterium]|nr:beta-lactamase family protein [Pseudomonadales bacterium]
MTRTAAWMAGILCLTSASAAFTEDAVGQTDDIGRFEAYLDGVMAAQFTDYRLAGMTFALVRNGRLVFSKGYGHADLAAAVRVDPARHLFRPGSVSKLVTWTAVMQLVEQGRLDLQADVSQYVPQFEIPNAFGVPLTLTHIMTHTPGLEDGAAGFLFADEPTDLVPLAESLAAHIPAQVRAPGTFASYSNWASALAGLIVANVTGRAFEDYVRTEIFEPLGMQHATFEEPLPADLAEDFAQGYVLKYEGLEPFGFEYIHNFGPAGALSASAEDMSRFLIAHLQDGAYGGRRILREETARLMHARLFAHHPDVAGMAHGFYEIRRNGERFIGHGGDTIAFHSELVMQPETDFGFFLSFNAAEGAMARTAVTDAVLDYFYPGHPERLPAFPAAPLEGSAARIAAVVGAYRLNRRSYTQLEGITGLGGDLSVVPAGPGEISIPVPRFGGRFIEVAPYVFREQGRQELLVFETSPSGQVQRALIGSLPVMVADRLSFPHRASTHQLIIALALLASLFVVINAIRNRGRQALQGAAAHAKTAMVGAAVVNLLFPIGLVAVFAGVD